MTNEFEPVNLLEEKLIALYRKEITIPEFLGILLESQVIILADRDVDITGPDMHFNPLAINSSMGFDALAIFTSLDRAKRAFLRYPGYGFAVAVDTSWFLQGAYENAGIALNPGWPYGFELSPAILQRLLVSHGLKKGPGRT